jgi:glycosyltransferase involved in cell wall biosynthesis
MSNSSALTLAMIGTRGVPAAYGGFETAVEEVGRRLVERGHHVIVYTRGSEHRRKEYLGMRIVHLPAVPQKQLETLSHTGLSALHAITRRRPDAAFVFNAANAPFVPLLRLRGIPVALHMDGLEWRRSKWGDRGRAYYRWAEQFGVRNADALIADAPGIADYYAHQFGAPTEMIRYGAPILEASPGRDLSPFGVVAGGYHLVVARFEPENHVLEIVEGYHRSSATLPLLVVGSAPYSAEYTQRIQAIADADPRIRLLGGVFDQELLDTLYADAATYLHGHSVGGTNPSLLRAMGAETAVIAYDVSFNREVLDGRAWFFDTPAEAADAIEQAEREPRLRAELAQHAIRRAAAAFRWDDVASAYEDVAVRIASGATVHPRVRHAVRNTVEWQLKPAAATAAVGALTASTIRGARAESRAISM